jgi:hypothetical protein
MSAFEEFSDTIPEAKVSDDGNDEDVKYSARVAAENESEEEEPLCSFCLTGDSPSLLQELYKCHSCTSMSNSECCCVGCAYTCHGFCEDVEVNILKYQIHFIVP